MTAQTPVRQTTRLDALFFVSILVLAVVGRVWVSLPTWLHWDENYYLNIAQNYIDRGDLTPYMWRLDDSNIIAGSGSGYGLLALTEWLRLVDGSLFGGRLLMVIAGVVSAGVIYAVAREWWESELAGLAALAFAAAGTSPFFTLVLRMDSLGILLYCLVLWGHIRAVRRPASPWVHAGLGVAAVVAVEFHTLGVLYLIALTLYYFQWYVREVWTARRLLFNVTPVYFAAAGFVAGVAYIALHILPDPEAYFLISRECFECNESVFVTESKRLVRFALLRPHELLLIVVVLLAAVVRGRTEDRHYLILAVGWLVAQAAVGPPPYTHYTNHFWPLLAVGVGGFVARGFDGTFRRWRVVVGLNVALVMLVTVLALHATGFQPYLISYQLEDRAEIDAIHASVPPDAVVMGLVESFYPLRDYHNFLSYRDGDAYGTASRDETMLEFWRRIQPTAILLEPDEYADDDELRQYLVEGDFEQVLPDLWLAPRLADAYRARLEPTDP